MADPATRMTSLAEVMSHLTAHLPKVEPQGDERARLTVAVAVPGGEPTRRVDLRRVDVDGAAWVEIISTIGPARQVPPLAALARNFGLAIGTLCVLEGQLALRQLLPLDGLRAADLDEVVQVVAQQSAEAAYGRPPGG